MPRAGRGVQAGQEGCCSRGTHDCQVRPPPALGSPIQQIFIVSSVRACGARGDGVGREGEGRRGVCCGSKWGGQSLLSLAQHARGLPAPTPACTPNWHRQLAQAALIACQPGGGGLWRVFVPRLSLNLGAPPLALARPPPPAASRIRCKDPRSTRHATAGTPSRHRHHALAVAGRLRQPARPLQGAALPPQHGGPHGTAEIGRAVDAPACHHWDSCKRMRRPWLRRHEPAAFLFDGHNILDHAKMRDIGFIVYGLGKPLDPFLQKHYD